MEKTHKFLISYIINNQPASVEASTEADSLTKEDALAYIKNLPSAVNSDIITDVQVMGYHHIGTARPGFYQQPEG